MVLLIQDLTPDVPEGYRWKWGSWQTQERLNRPDIFYGILDVLYQNEGNAFSDLDEDLLTLQSQIDADVLGSYTFTRPAEGRNLFRQNKEYWTHLGLLSETRAIAELTAIGRSVASGEMPREAFASQTIRTLNSPNPITQSSLVEIQTSCRPLYLILELLQHLAIHYPTQACLTPNCLGSVVVPLSSIGASVQLMAECLIRFRDSPSDFDSWIDCGETESEIRSLREFLRFLEYSGYLSCRANQTSRRHSEFIIANHERVSLLLDIGESPPPEIPPNAIPPSLTPARRARRLARVIARPGQARFRRDVLEACGQQCLITGETHLRLVQAAHILDVSEGGPDHISNGIPMRADLHILFDSGALRINPENGQLVLNHAASGSTSCQNLPNAIEIPNHISQQYLVWKFNANQEEV